MNKPLDKKALARRKWARVTVAADKKFAKAIQQHLVAYKLAEVTIDQMYQLAIKPFHDELVMSFNKAQKELDKATK